MTGYLLSTTHADGAPKAVFLERFGFSQAKPEALRAALLAHAFANEGSGSRKTAFGVIFEIDGDRRPPDQSRRPQSRGPYRLDDSRRGNRAAIDYFEADRGHTQIEDRGMIEELDRVVLMRDVPEDGLVAGDVGAVVAKHQDGRGYTVEVMSLTGDTIAIVTLTADAVRPIREREVANARQVA